MASKRDYYEILGVKKDATKAQIKAAYRKAALTHHPDKNKAPDAEAKFKEINEAYAILSDEQKRRTYDQFGHEAANANGGGNPFAGGNPFGGAGGGPFTWQYSSSGGNPFGGGAGEGFEDIFEQFFGGGFGGGPRRPQYSLRISFMDAALGAEKAVEIEGKKRTVKIPAGADTGTKLRFDDFDITFEVEPHAEFRREGYDLFIDQKITFVMAALGGEVSVKTLEKAVKLKIRPGTQSHTLVRLRGEGISEIRGRGRGDLYVRLIVAVPEKLSGTQKRLLKELRDLE